MPFQFAEDAAMAAVLRDVLLGKVGSAALQREGNCTKATPRSRTSRARPGVAELEKHGAGQLTDHLLREACRKNVHAPAAHQERRLRADAKQERSKELRKSARVRHASAQIRGLCQRPEC